jgi:hypothetical protein
MVLLTCLWELADAGLITIDGFHNSNDSLHDILHQQAEFGIYDDMDKSALRKIRASNQYIRTQRALGLDVSGHTQKPFYNDLFQTAIIPVFGEPNDLPIQADVFVLMPFVAEMTPIYRDHIVPLVERLGMKVMRADDLFTNNAVISDVWSGIFGARLVIADCTGRNPNVFYEIGIAHTLGRQTVLITQREEDIPIDIRHLRYICYEYSAPGMKKFEQLLSSTIASSIESHVQGL